MKSQKRTYSPYNSISSGNINYTGEIPACLLDCPTPTLDAILGKAFQILCYTYGEINSLSNVDLGKFKVYLDCDSKDLLNLFNLVFEILNSQEDSEKRFFWDFDIYNDLDCENLTIADTKCCSGDTGYLVEDVIQRLINRANTLSKETCDILDEIATIQGKISEIEEIMPTSLNQINLTCGQYWDGLKYVTKPSLITTKIALELLDKTLCKTNSILGVQGQLNINTSYYVENPTMPGQFYHNYSSANNALEVQNKIQEYLGQLKMDVSTLALQLASCCKTDCDLCVQAHFDQITTNYGQVAAGGGVPVITLTHNINTQYGPGCPENPLIVNESSYVLSDGINSVTIPLSGSTGMVILSGNVTTSARVAFVLSTLGLDYTKNINIKLKIKSQLGCEDSYKALIPAHDNPTCDTCMICFRKNNPYSSTNYTAHFTLNFSGGGYPTYSQAYAINTENPCVSIEKKKDQIITITDISQGGVDQATLCTTCDFLTGNIDLCCDKFIDENQALYQFMIPLSHAAAFEISRIATGNATLIPNPVADTPSLAGVNLDMRSDERFIFDYDRIITSFNPGGDILLGKSLEVTTPPGSSSMAMTANGNDDARRIMAKIPTTMPAYMTNTCSKGSSILTWAQDGQNGSDILPPSTLTDDTYGTMGSANPFDAKAINYPQPNTSSLQYVIGAISKDQKNVLSQLNASFNIVPETPGNDFHILCTQLQGQSETESPFIVLKDPVTESEIYVKGIPVTQCNC